MTINQKHLDTVFSAYLEAVEFTDFGEEGQPEHGSTFAQSALNKAKEEIKTFILSNPKLIRDYESISNMSYAQLGHDIWFTRNRYGLGFWDRGLGELGEELTAAAHNMGEIQAVFLGNDSLVYFE